MPRRRTETPGSKPVRVALQLLLEAPALAGRAEHLGQIALLKQPGLDILLDSIEFFAEHPDASAAQWLEANRGTPRGEALGRILAMPLSVTGNLDAEFLDCMNLLRRRAVRERQQALLDTARERPLEPSEQAELLALMQRSE